MCWRTLSGLFCYGNSISSFLISSSDSAANLNFVHYISIGLKFILYCLIRHEANWLKYYIWKCKSVTDRYSVTLLVMFSRWIELNWNWETGLFSTSSRAMSVKVGKSILHVHDIRNQKASNHNFVSLQS